MERRSYDWFEKRRRTKGLELAHEQITKAFDTVTLLHKAMKSFAEGNRKESKKYIENWQKEFMSIPRVQYRDDDSMITVV